MKVNNLEGDTIFPATKESYYGKQLYEIIEDLRILISGHESFVYTDDSDRITAMMEEECITKMNIALELLKQCIKEG